MSGHEPCWVAGAPTTRYPRFESSERTEVAVVGAGIVGLTVAFLLAKSGHDVTLLEAMRVGENVTGRSTAKVTSQHGLALTRIAREHGTELAQLYAQANAAGAGAIVRLAGELGIECDLEPRPAYAFTQRVSRRGAVEREARLAREFGMPASFLRRAPLPFANEGAVVYRGQAQFNPVKYLVGIAASARRAGARIFERTRVTDVAHKRGEWRLTMGRHVLHAERVVAATHMPIGSPVPFDERTQPRCHVAGAFRAKRDALDGMFISVDERAHSLRMAHDPTGPLVVALAPTFPTGHDGDVAEHLRALEVWVQQNVGAGKAAWSWINEDYDSFDGLPFAGELARKAPRLYVATGFGGWGLSNGAAAALLIADQIDGRRNPWTPLYHPERRGRKINQGGDAAVEADNIDDIAPGSGAVVTYRKQKIAIYKSRRNEVTALDAKCTHMGCPVTWNNLDETWNCPCHGSLFACNGDVLHGPATAPLKKIRLPKGLS